MIYEMRIYTVPPRGVPEYYEKFGEIFEKRQALSEVEQVTKQFPGVKALQDVNLTLHQGEVLAVIGENGAGKSTTIRMIMSIIHPDSGTIDVLGTTAIEAKDRIGYLPEERGVYRKMKVCAFIEYIGKLKGMRGSLLKTKVHDWLERIELPDIHNKRCEELSKGMQQKVQFLAAIIHDPELIILDEPFTGLDPVNAKIIGKIIVISYNCSAFNCSKMMGKIMRQSPTVSK